MTENMKTVYLYRFRAWAHQLIRMGYQSAGSRCQQLAEEDTITGHIVGAIKEKLREPRAEKWLRRIAVHESEPMNDGPLQGSKRKKPDLVIEFIYSGRPAYTFEAKRLKRPGFPASRYLGKDGLGCFIAGQYAMKYREAAMLGYVQSDSVAWWAAYLRTCMEKDGKTFDYPDPWAFQHEWTTRHRRKDLPTIEIYHILLCCTSEPNGC